MSAGSLVTDDELKQAGRPAPMRTAVRFPLRLPVRVRTDGGLMPAETLDISSAGVLFLMQSSPCVGSMLEWRLRLPGTLMGTPHDVTVDCVGRVVWSKAAADGTQIGTEIEHYVLKEEEHE